MVAPCYYLACPIFEDSGFRGRLRAVPEDADGIDIDYLAHGLQEIDAGILPCRPVSIRFTYRGNFDHCIPYILLSS